jgi:hypothetical protein
LEDIGAKKEELGPNLGGRKEAEICLAAGHKGRYSDDGIGREMVRLNLEPI